MNLARPALLASLLLVLPSLASAVEVTFQIRAEGASQVFLAGEFNGWSDTAQPVGDDDGDGVFTVTLDLDPGTYQYKYVVDGTWMPDPAATQGADDSFGGQNSIVEVGDTAFAVGPDAAAASTPAPAAVAATGDGEHAVRFLCKASANADVYLAGEFNGWDAAGQRMEPTAEDPTVYQAVLNLDAGRYAYKFVVNGTWKQDDFATEFVDDSFGGQNSVVVVAATDGVQDAGNYADLGAAPATSTSAAASTPVLGESVSGSRSVTFAYQPLISGVSEVMLAGSFNDWNVGATPMTDPDGNGIYEATLLLDAGEYQYKYVVDGTWLTPEEADGYLDDGFGGQNAVIQVDSRYDAIDVEVGDNDIYTEGIEIAVDYSTINEHADGEFLIQVPAYRGDIAGIRLHWREAGGETRVERMVAADRSTAHTNYRASISATPGQPLEFTFEYVDGQKRLWTLASGGFAEEMPGDAEWFRYDREILPLFRIPEWAQKGVYYQIFPERFANGDPTNDQDFSEPYYDQRKTLPASGRTNDVYFHFVEDWNDVAGLQRSPYRTDGKPDYFSFYGGDIAGIHEKIPYLRELGVTIIYFNPVTEARSNHRYDPCDYKSIDPHLGTEEEFKAFAAECLENGIRIIVDMAYNHTGDCHFAFQDVLENWTDSPYYDWYEWKKRPPSYPLPAGAEAIDYYDCWWGFGLHPNLNFDLSRPNAEEMSAASIEDADPNWDVVNYLLDSVDYWMGDLGVSGFRLDVPNEVPFWFWKLFRERCREVREDHVLIGEIWGDAGQWINPDVFDAVMNYRYFKDPVVKWIGQGNGSAATFDQELAGGRSRYPWQAVRAQMNLVGSHDTIRFKQIAGEDARRQRLAATFAMTYVGAPHIYYGDEVALTGGKDPDCRRTMPWDQIELGERAENLAHYRTVANLRHEHPALSMGSFQTLFAEGQVFAFTRQYQGETFLVALNNAEAEASAVLPLGNAKIADGAPLEVLLGDAPSLAGDAGGLSVTRGALQIHLGPLEGVILKVGS